MKAEENTTRDTVEHLKQIILIKFKLFKFQLVENTARVGASVASSVVAYVVLFLCVVFASLALAYGVAEMTGHVYLGFAVMALFYLVIFISIKFIWKRLLKKALMDYIIKNMFEKNEQ